MNDWHVHFIGGPLDGRTEIYASSDRVPRLAVRAIFDDGQRDQRASIQSIALYELDSHEAGSRYHYVQSLPVTGALRATLAT